VELRGDVGLDGILTEGINEPVTLGVSLQVIDCFKLLIVALFNQPRLRLHRA
jgi:hypothetical protein